MSIETDRETQIRQLSAVLRSAWDTLQSGDSVERVRGRLLRALIGQAGGVEVTLSCPGPFYQVYVSGVDDMAYHERRRSLLLPMEGSE